ncbi:hypothetical protein OE810_03575 [Rhodobacteraceae bacterium XHP0102]|nr:hypothetical protein [Rhodobacteraceae bacterium XHP0102]
MTNTIAIWLGGLILSLVAVDVLLWDQSGLIFIGKLLVEVLTKMAFWR